MPTLGHKKVKPFTPTKEWKPPDDYTQEQQPYQTELVRWTEEDEKQSPPQTGKWMPKGQADNSLVDSEPMSSRRRNRGKRK